MSWASTNECLLGKGNPAASRPYYIHNPHRKRQARDIHRYVDEE